MAPSKKYDVTMRLNGLLLVLLSCMVTGLFADSASSDSEPDNMKYPYYIGLMTGYGNTDWGQLVSQDDLSSFATPTSAVGSGAILGGLVGYQLTQYLAIEAQYIHYPNSLITLAPDNPYYGGVGSFHSTTNYYAIMPKIEAPFDHDRFEAFGTLGGAFVTRSDVLANIHNFRPTFGLGLSYIAYKHWNFSFAFNYTPGTGVGSQYTTAQYIPYLYAGELIVSYRL